MQCCRNSGSTNLRVVTAADRKQHSIRNEVYCLAQNSFNTAADGAFGFTMLWCGGKFVTSPFIKQFYSSHHGQPRDAREFNI